MRIHKLDALSIEELYALADKTGLDLPPGLERPFVVEEILEALEEDSEDRRAAQGEAVHIDEKKYSGLRIGDFDLDLDRGESLAFRYNETMIQGHRAGPFLGIRVLGRCRFGARDASRRRLLTAGIFLRVSEIGATGENGDSQREYLTSPSRTTTMNGI